MAEMDPSEAARLLVASRRRGSEKVRFLARAARTAFWLMRKTALFFCILTGHLSFNGQCWQCSKEKCALTIPVFFLKLLFKDSGGTDP